MLLNDIRHYLKKRGSASLDDVAIHFDMDSNAAAFALNYWIKKGKLNKLGGSCGSSCGSCGSGELYQWQETSVFPLRWLKQ